jgi:hypothetical protein
MLRHLTYIVNGHTVCGTKLQSALSSVGQRRTFYGSHANNSRCRAINALASGGEKVFHSTGLRDVDFDMPRTEAVCFFT